MRHFIIGFVVGCAVTNVIILLLHTSANPSAPFPDSSLDEVGASASTLSREETTAETAIFAESETQQGNASLGAAQGLQSIEESAPISQPEFGEVAIAVPFQEEFEPLMAGRAARRRAELEREAIDPVWAPTTEANFYNFLSERPELLAEFRVPSMQVHCRSTLCEIQIVTDVTNPRSLIQYFSELLDEPWAADFEPGVASNGFHFRRNDGVTTILWYKRRES